MSGRERARVPGPAMNGKDIVPDTACRVGMYRRVQEARDGENGSDKSGSVTPDNRKNEIETGSGLHEDYEFLDQVRTTLAIKKPKIVESINVTKKFGAGTETAE